MRLTDEQCLIIAFVLLRDIIEERIPEPVTCVAQPKVNQNYFPNDVLRKGWVRCAVASCALYAGRPRYKMCNLSGSGGNQLFIERETFG